MAKQKIIYWRPDMEPNEKGESFANVHLLVGYNEANIDDLLEMAEELRQTFPQAKFSEICTGKVSRSDTVYGFTIIAWAAHLPKGAYPGWIQKDNGVAEYNW